MTWVESDFCLVVPSKMAMNSNTRKPDNLETRVTSVPPANMSSALLRSF